MHKILFFAAVVSILAMSSYGASEVPFTLEKGLIVVKAKIKKDIPVDVVIATGSASSFVNMDFVLRNKIQTNFTGDRDNKPLLYVNVMQVIIGDEKPVSLDMKPDSLESSNKKAGREIAATLGADFFRGKILQIDFKKKVIRFLDEPGMDYKAFRAEPPSPGTKTFVLQMGQLSENFMYRPVVLPVVDGLTLNGAKVRSLLDTFVPYPVTVSPDAIKQFDLGTVPDKGTTQPTKMKSFSFGGLEITDIPAMLLGKNVGFDERVSDHGTIIGVAVLQNFTVTFDWKDKVVVLER